MSEKRFKLSKYVTPSSVSYFCDENGKMLNKEVVKVLNELNDENDILKQQLKTKYIVNKQYEELQKLKKQCNEQQAIIRRDEMSIKTMMSNMKKLEEENEELKEIHQKGSKSCEKWKQHKEAQIQQLEKENEDLREVNKENQLLHEENVKQCERWKNLYELKDAEVTARVDALNKVCEYYTSEVLFKSDTDPNEAVKEVINRILNTEVEMW